MTKKNSHLAFSARWERTRSGLNCPCWGSEVLILVAWLAFGFWHQPTHAASAETKFTWGLPCLKEDDVVCS